jgi:hypothetical protein
MQLPKGRLGTMVLAFGSAGIATALLLYPTRASSGTLVQVYWRHWFSLLPLPLLLLFIAVQQRMQQYGLSESRYLVVLAGVWMAILALAFLLRRGERDLRLVPGVLALLLLIASFGPWGAEGLPQRLQVAELTRILGGAGVLKDGRIDAAVVAGKSVRFTDPDRRRAHAIVDYLSRDTRLDRLQPLFTGTSNNPFADASVVQHSRAMLVKEALGIGRDVPGSPGRYVSLSWNLPGILEIASASRLVGPINIYARKRDAANDVIIDKDGIPSVKVALDSNRIIVTDIMTGQEAAFEPLAPSIVKQRLEVGLGPAKSPLALRPVTGQLPGELVVLNMSAQRGNDDAFELQSMSFLLLLK